MKVQITQKKSKGYKQTEIGVIPEDWNVVRLNLLSNDIGDGIHSTPKYVDSSNYFFVNGNNLSDGRILITRDTKCISEDEYESLKKNLDNTTILMSINGTIGNLAFFNNETVVLGKSAAYIKLSQRIDKIFIYYLLQHSSIKKFYDNELTGTTIKNLSLASIRSTPVPIPPTKPEQTAIATALSDTDALIERLGKLIAKKKAIKQGTMQLLLTGKKRLPGFSGEWEVKKLGDLLYYEQPTKYLVKDTEYNDNNDTPVLTAGKTFILGYTNEEFGIFDNIPVIIFDDFTTANKFVTFPFKAKSSAMKILIPTGEDVNLRFVYEKMQLIDFPLGDHKRYWISEYQNLKIGIPKPEEQTAIATILFDMDAEIKRLEQKKDKYTMLKQGMMQQLLTGRIRIYANN
jgi:type I restriction enzyme S subunit